MSVAAFITGSSMFNIENHLWKFVKGKVNVSLLEQYVPPDSGYYFVESLVFTQGIEESSYRTWVTALAGIFFDWHSVVFMLILMGNGRIYL